MINEMRKKANNVPETSNTLNTASGMLMLKLIIMIVVAKKTMTKEYMPCKLVDEEERNNQEKQDF